MPSWVEAFTWLAGHTLVSSDYMKCDKQNSQIVMIIHIKVFDFWFPFFFTCRKHVENINFMNVELFLIYLFKGNVFSTMFEELLSLRRNSAPNSQAEYFKQN